MEQRYYSDIQAVIRAGKRKAKKRIARRRRYKEKRIIKDDYYNSNVQIRGT